MASEETTHRSSQEKGIDILADKLSLAAAVDRLLEEASFVEALYSNESLQTLLNEVERMQAFSEILHVHQRNVLSFLKLAVDSEDSQPAMVWNYVAEQLLSVISDDLVNEDSCAKVVAELKGLAVVLDASRYEGSQRLTLLKESMNQIFEIREDFSETVINYLSLKSHEVHQLFKDATNAKKFKTAISKYLKKHQQETLNHLKLIIAELERGYGEPWLYKMCKQLYGLLPNRTKIRKQRRRLSEPPAVEKLSGLHLDVSEVKKVLESHYSNVNQTVDEKDGSEKRYLRMLPSTAMPLLNYSILKKDTGGPVSTAQKETLSSEPMEPVSSEPKADKKQTPEKGKSHSLTEPQSNAREVSWDSLPNTERDRTDGDSEKASEDKYDQQTTSLAPLRRVEKRKMSPINKEASPSSAKRALKKKNSYHRWDDHQDYLLKKGIEKHGLGEWKAILDDPELDWPSYRTNVQLKDRARTLKIV
ncbi:hypothetical protein Gasu2_47490 [Galdieria sulphuraria]|uniref:DNA-binding protein, putative n=1 Tax=Galdieria sulphuraria TaxID=130081 RepID=M2W7H1_GALSU|nr:DNA-binding protein, putative [Galdieria sulphuraria]EME31766.1 DNA-binding protein, putative [Galdieria sulphuraria]GJD10567.1 hypothetical protein Gasu2_47490 [Galdieria sulphuraria]|eukprot:XP_005708286.1 DNA-binding protein, putative [Galdieria sulphuraria]